MDFNSITTPSDLVDQNSQITEDGKRGIKLLEDVLEEGPRYGLCTAKILVEKLIKIWQADLVKLQMVSDILDDIEV